MLLIDQNQSQIRHRRKHRRPRPNHHPRLTPPNPMPLLGPLIRRQLRVQQRHLSPKRRHHLRRGPRRQPNLRNQQQRTLPAASARCIAATYTAVFPLPVIPYSRCGLKPPFSIAATIVPSASVCASFSTCSCANFFPSCCRPGHMKRLRCLLQPHQPPPHQRPQRGLRNSPRPHPSPQLPHQLPPPTTSQLRHHRQLILIQLRQPLPSLHHRVPRLSPDGPIVAKAG